MVQVINCPTAKFPGETFGLLELLLIRPVVFSLHPSCEEGALLVVFLYNSLGVESCIIEFSKKES